MGLDEMPNWLALISAMAAELAQRVEET